MSRIKEEVSDIRYLRGIRYQVYERRYQISGIKEEVSDVRYIRGVIKYQVYKRRY